MDDCEGPREILGAEGALRQGSWLQEGTLQPAESPRGTAEGQTEGQRAVGLPPQPGLRKDF